MDKYKQKKPKSAPYRYQNSRSTCCYSRVGQVKKSFGSKKEAEKKLKEFGGELYPCLVHPDRWHIRSRR